MKQQWYENMKLASEASQFFFFSPFSPTAEPDPSLHYQQNWEIFGKKTDSNFQTLTDTEMTTRSARVRVHFPH